MTETNTTPAAAAVALPRDIEIKIILNEKQNPPGKVADAEILFSMGILAGLKLTGFGVWERRGNSNPGGYNVTFPARQYSVNGERRSFALLRPIIDICAQAAIHDAIITTYRATVEPAEQPEQPATPAASPSCERATMPQDARPREAAQPVIDF